jgi:hypothetical protein
MESDFLDMEIVVMRTRKDYGVVTLELRISGFRRISCYPLKYPKREMDKITKQLSGGESLYPLDMCLVDSSGYIHFARLLADHGIIKYVISMTKIRRSANLKKFVNRLQQHGWKLVFRVRPLRRRTHT